MKKWLRLQLDKYYRLSDEEILFLAQNGRYLSLKPGEKYLHAGNVADKIGLLKSGILRACQLKNTGEIITNYFYYLPDNDIVTLQTSFSKNIISEHSVEAITDCEIFSFDKEIILKAFYKYPGMDRLSRIIAEKQYLDSSKRINDLQTKSASEIYKAFVKEKKYLVLQVPQNMIASYLGMSQFTLSKLKKKS